MTDRQSAGRNRGELPRAASGAPPPAAILDVDGTLVPDRLGVAFAAAAFPEEYPYVDGIKPAVEAYEARRRAGHRPAVAGLARELVDHWARGLTGRCQAVIRAQAAAFIADYAIPPAVPRVMRALAGHGYRLVLVSLSPQEVLEPFATAIAPTGTVLQPYGTAFAIDAAGRYTGELARDMVRDGKTQPLAAVFTTATRQGSLALGDDDTDLPILETVDHPVVIGAPGGRLAARVWPTYPDLAGFAAALPTVLATGTAEVA